MQLILQLFQVSPNLDNVFIYHKYKSTQERKNIENLVYAEFLIESVK